jgi:hypothetical protein
MRTRIAALLVAVALLGPGAAPARAQNPSVDSRWIAYLGCWQTVWTDVKQSTICLVPADAAAADLVTIENGEVVGAERFIADAQRVETARGECTGWHSAEWSAVSDRLYLQSAETCPGWGTRLGSGLMTMSPEGHLLYVQGSIVGLKSGVHVQRYRKASADVVLPSEVKDALDALQLDVTVTAQAAAAASAAPAIEDVAEAARALDAVVVEAWLVERGGSFTLDADRLVALAKAGVPARITDLMIALSHPGVFHVDAGARSASRREPTTTTDFGPSYTSAPTYGECFAEYLPFSYSLYYCGGFGYMLPFAWNPYTYPVSISYTGSGSGGGTGDGARSHGRVVNGRGYREGVTPSSDVSRWGRDRAPAGAAAPPSSTSTSASSGGGRTAKPRP